MNHANEPTHIDLYAGIGGFSLAFEAEGFRTIGFSEINPDKCLVYNHWFPAVPNLGDIKRLVAYARRKDLWERLAPYVGVDVLTGGVPCQPASALGQMRGAEDERWLWPATLRLVGLLRPRFGVFENPPSLLVLNGGREWNGIVSGLVARGYDCWWEVLPAAAFGAGHLRERVILVIADASQCGREERAGFCAGESSGERLGRLGDASGAVASNSNRAGLQGHAEHGADGEGWAGSGRSIAPPDLRGRCNQADWWHEVNTGVPVLADGLPSRLVEAAARCAGDAVVPQVIQPIARAIRSLLT